MNTVFRSANRPGQMQPKSGNRIERRGAEKPRRGAEDFLHSANSADPLRLWVKDSLSDFGFRIAPCRAGFTMIEIALCLAVIGFALIAIIGVLPTGMGVQKENRWETVVDEDAYVWMNALRGGGRGYDDLTNFVVGITNTVVNYTINGNGIATPQGQPTVYGYNYGGSATGYPLASTAMNPPVRLTNGFNIIGVLSTPRYTGGRPGVPGGAFQSNHVVAYVRGMSGPAHEKYPQTNQTVLDTAFTYRLIPDMISYVPVDPYSTNFVGVPGPSPMQDRFRLVQYMTTNSADLRLTFRWPVLANGDIGNYRQSFRTFVGGQPANFASANPKTALYFFQPSIYMP